MNRRRFLASLASAAGASTAVGPSGGNGGGRSGPPAAASALSEPRKRTVRPGVVAVDPDVFEEIERRVDGDLLDAHDEALREGFSWEPE